MADLRESFKIVLLCIVAAVVYGVCNDMVTAHISVEYFSVHHPPVLGGTGNPILLALVWGVIATWWTGLLLGLLIAPTARLGSEPKLSTKQLVVPVMTLMAFVLVTSALVGIAGWLDADVVRTVLSDDDLLDIAPERRDRFRAVFATHSAAYTMAVFGTLVLCVWIVLRRYQGQSSDESMSV